MAKTERQVGRQAKTKLKSDLESIIKKSGLKLKGGKDSLAQVSTSFRMVKGEPTHLRGIAIIMPKHGFIQSHGVNTKRASHILTKKTGKSVIRKAHPFKMKQTPILQDLMKNNDVVDYVANEITRLRGEEVVLKIKNYLES